MVQRADAAEAQDRRDLCVFILEENEQKSVNGVLKMESEAKGRPSESTLPDVFWLVFEEFLKHNSHTADHLIARK